MYKHSRLRNKFWKGPSKENELLFETKEVSRYGESALIFFKDVTKKDLIANKLFWNFVRAFLSNKNGQAQHDIMFSVF